MKKKIGIWGQYGSGGQIADGQAVRTTVITKELIDRYGENNISVLNTEFWQKHPLKFFLDSIKLYLNAEKIIIAPADNGFKVVSVIYGVLWKIFKKELYDIVIGGYLPGLLKDKPGYIKRLKKYTALFVQTPNLKSDLEAFGLSNIFILSNLKRLNTRKIDEISLSTNRNIKVCTLSRINESKGIDDAVNAVKIANRKLGGDYIKLDIFGIVADDYKEHFEQLIASNDKTVKYGGILQYDKTVETLKDYFVMLFPTYYYGEGFPGNVIDALNSGLPMIATDWRYNKEVIIDGRNGILVPPHSPETIADALLDLYNNREIQLSMAKNNINDAMKYTPDQVLAKLYEFLD